MRLRIILVLLLFGLSHLAAVSYEPRYYLKGCHPLTENKINLFKIQKYSFATGSSKIMLPSLEVRTIHEIQYERQRLKFTASFQGRTDLIPSVYTSLSNFKKAVVLTGFRNLLFEKSQQILEQKDRKAGEGLIPEIVIDLPNIALPKAVKRFMGNKAGRLSLDGSQKLTFAGSSTTTDNPGDEADRNQNFDLEMRQDLNLRLRGTIGEKIHVDVRHSSTSEDNVLKQPNQINISYEGFEDEVVKSIEGGNIALSLTGSKFISYSASSEGLFGIKSRMEFGELKLTTILGKDEAKKSTKKYKGSTQADSVNIRSRDFARRTYFYIDDPDALYETYTLADSLAGEGYYPGYAGNAIKTDASGAWIIKSPQLLPDIGSLQLYYDDNNAYNNDQTVEGTDLNGFGNYNFKLMLEGSEYLMDYNTGILRIMINIDRNFTIGVIYTRNGEDVGNYEERRFKILKAANQDVSSPYWNLEMRNIYSLNMQNIKSEGFSLDVFTYGADNTKNYYNDDGILLTQYLRLDQNGDGIINGEDASIDLQSGMVIFPFLRPFDYLGDPKIYESETVTYDDFKHWIGVKGKIGREQITLNQMNILPGSVVIKLTTIAETRTLKENVHYLVDYDFGIITLLDPEAKDSDNNLDISYQFKPLFAIESKTLMGIRADMQITDQLKLGGTFIYQSEKVADDRPKIGNENRSLILADIDGSFGFDVPFLTTMVDLIPLIRTDEESKVEISGEVAMSLPRIYGSDEQDDKKEAYIDDMESILDTYPLGVVRRTWVQASKPFTNDFGRAGINWYNPQNIEAREIYDPETLTDREENEKVSVLACKIEPPPLGNPGIDNKYWAGVMKYVGDQVDLSRKKYIEFLVKVDSLPANTSPKPVIIHINLGDVNEDFYTDFGGEGILNSEDGLAGTYPDGSLDFGEDLGLDGIKTGNPGDDPNDDFSNEDINIDGDVEYPDINGTEGNGYLDTEDLDGNGYLNTREVYFQYSVSLFDTLSSYFSSEYNGWRLFRIPLAGQDNFQIVSDNGVSQPDLEKISFARVWFEVEEKTRIKIVSFDIVGNKWEETSIKDQNDIPIQSDYESMIVGIIDNQKNPHYTPAPGTVIEKDNEATLEQSLIIDYQNLGADHYGLVRQQFRDASSTGKGLDLLGYSRIRFWVYAESDYDIAQDSLIIRMGADSLNYYQIKYPVTVQPVYAQMLREGWEEIELVFSDLTYLKSLAAGTGVHHISINGKSVSISLRGKPTLSNIKEIRLGMQAVDVFNGRVYFNDIRVADPYEDIGFAARTDLRTNFADFSTLDVNFNWKTPNFRSTATRTQTQSYTQSTDLNITNRYNLHKFFPADWGFSLPLVLSRNSSVGIPRFKANSDILRADLPPEEKEREINQSLTQSASLNFSQNKTPASKILAYTVKNTTVNASIQKKEILNSTNTDTTMTYTLKHTYKLDIPKENIDLKLWSDFRFYFFPNSFSNSLTYKAEYPRKWRWDTYTDSIPYWVPQSNVKDIKTLDTDTDVKYDIFSDLKTSYKLTTQRDLLLSGSVYGLPLGLEKRRTQNITANYDPAYFARIFTVSLGSKVTYKDENKKQSYTSEEDYLFYGDVNRNVSVSFTLKNKDLLSTLVGIAKKGKVTQPPQSKQPGNQPVPPGKEPGQEQKESFELPPDLKQLPPELPEGKDPDQIQEQFKPEEITRDPEKPEPEPEQTKTDSLSDEELPPESKGPGFNPLRGLVTYLARLDNIKLNYSNDYGTTYEKRDSRPEFLYQLGIPHALADEELKRKIKTEKISASTGIPIIDILSTSWGYSYEIKKTYENPAEDFGNMVITTTFPNVTVTLTEFEKLIRAQKILTSSRLTSSYVVTVVERGNIDWDKPQNIRTTISLQPLISWNGNWQNNITTNLSFNYLLTENVTDNGDFRSINRENRQSMNGNFSWTFSAERGIRMPFFQKKIRFKNEMTATVGFNMERTYNTRSGTGDEVVERDMLKYTISPGASYKFSQNIRAGLTSNYDWNHNRKSNQKIRTFRLGIWIEIIF
ncbi:MAG: cell surface protein SprA [Candidatus Cloacimonetes bacterium]|nr:cell surface protein SprA [Candidatus Cloacimonadota bacterium]